jgi:hypothetical protein
VRSSVTSSTLEPGIGKSRLTAALSEHIGAANKNNVGEYGARFRGGAGEQSVVTDAMESLRQNACKANIARVRRLITAPLPAIDWPTEQDDPDVITGAKAASRPPCPCCGGRMVIVESFGPGGGPRAPPSPQAGVETAMP